MTDTPVAPATVPAVPRKAWLAFAVLILGVAMGMLDTTIVNVALPTIRTSLSADEATLSWIIAGYALAYGLVLIPAGRIGDRFGHKWVFIVGLTGFTVASLFCGIAADGGHLVIARVAQGLFGGMFFPPVTALIQLMFPGRVRGTAFAIMGAAIGVSTALGPIVGGLLIEALGDAEGWRSIFFVNLPFGVLAVIAAILILPSGAEGADAKGADWFGFLLLGGGLVAILVPLIEGQDQDWPLWTWLSLAGGVVLIVLFALWEVLLTRRGRTTPLVPPHLFSHPAFTGGVVLALVYFAAFTSIFFTISILWQAGLGHTALESGLVSIPFALGSIVGASQSDRIAHRFGRTALVIGTGLVSLGLIAVWLVLLLVPAADLTNWELLAPLAVAGIGSGLFIAPNAQFIVATVDRAEAGAASGVIGTMQRIGSAIGIAVIGSVFFGTLDISGPTDVASSFAESAAHAMLVSAIFAVAAFALVFVLPKRVDRGYEIPSAE
ncbi:MFS transporter [Protaetiibacter larvae]|uniref:MFS transporter n=1 Tax=Protaetiibacter larvae TaxID=2592654 RepID=A0A5C1Y927_9MICO|nr:MFS transporter [Protaetiibacter larvae]QEO10411.1 MFS transporter [Protaetiibacter larvae]